MRSDLDIAHFCLIVHQQMIITQTCFINDPTRQLICKEAIEDIQNDWKRRSKSIVTFEYHLTELMDDESPDSVLSSESDEIQETHSRSLFSIDDYDQLTVMVDEDFHQIFLNKSSQIASKSTFDYQYLYGANSSYIKDINNGNDLLLSLSTSAPDSDESHQDLVNIGISLSPRQEDTPRLQKSFIRTSHFTTCEELALWIAYRIVGVLNVSAIWNGHKMKVDIYDQRMKKMHGGHNLLFIQKLQKVETGELRNMSHHSDEEKDNSFVQLYYDISINS
eukprot:GHVH01003997.1.p1 GENE.GHVH01003997.1~~GHVH01003997.1.p1  ORF type:complete len:277 (-),score=48.05 GHVH01003997.1:23-853(-)